MKKFLNILYPAKCPVCHQILDSKDTLVDQKCEKLLHPVLTDYCLKCGRPVKAEEEFCRECREKPRAFDRGRGVFLYNNKMRQSLLHYKYYGNREYGEFYAASICRYMEREIRIWNPDVLIPVPMHPGKQRERGFNQAEDLASKAGQKLKIPFADDVVLKTRITKSQKTLNANERKRNLREAFCVTERLDGLRILVVDDVYTTGSTMEAMAQVLRQAGAVRIYFVTLCIGQL